MSELASPYSIRKGHYIEVLAEKANGEIVYGLMAKDGLIYRFHLCDIAEFLQNYPSDKEGWYWNHSKDRYAVERDSLDSDILHVNPAFVAEHFVARIYS